MLELLAKFRPGELIALLSVAGGLLCALTAIRQQRILRAYVEPDVSPGVV